MRTRTRLVAALAGGVLALGGLAGLTITPAAAASAPGKPKTVTAASDDGRYTLSWAKPKGKVDRFQVADRTKKKRGWSTWKTRAVKAKKTSLGVKGKNGSLHQARVRAHNAQGWGSWSKKVSVRVGLPDGVTGTTVTGGKKQATVAWTAASGNGATLTGYDVRTRAGSGAWTSASVAGTSTSHVLKDVAEDTEVQAQVRAKSAVGTGAWSAIASGRTHPKPAPKLTVNTPGPYEGGDVVTASVTGFPYDVTTLNIAVCANDGRTLMGPQDCATLSGASNKIVTVTKGAGSAQLTIPEDALGNTNGVPLDCADGTAKCAIVAATIGGDFHFAGPIVIEYVDPTLTVSNEGPFAGGETVTASFAGFPGDHPQINVAVCRMDQMPAGPQDCATLMGPSNQIVNATNGAGTTTLVIPTEISVSAPVATDPPIVLDCTVEDNCGIIATTITSDFHMAEPLILEFLIP